MAQGTIPGITFVVGGARSGKSAWAERLALASGLRPVYLATARGGDSEMASRIARHRERRGQAWTTVEVPLALPDALMTAGEAGSVVLVDCLTLWLSNLMEAGQSVDQSVEQLTKALGRIEGRTILVSNEVGLGIVPMNPLGREFRDFAGRLNQAVAGTADLAVFMVSGLPLTLKAPPAWEMPPL